MATKRPHPSTHPSRREQVPQDKSNKRRKTNPNPTRTLQPSNHAINPLKSRIRSLTRLLSHDDDDDDEDNNDDNDNVRGRKNPAARKPMPANIRIERERELASLRSQLADAERERRRKETISRFHMVRFFDRQKATRRLKRARRALGEARKRETALDAGAGGGGDVDGGVEEDGDDEDGVALVQRLQAELHDAQVDLNYALYFPLDLAYSSLWPRAKQTRAKRKGATDVDADAEPNEQLINATPAAQDPEADEEDSEQQHDKSQGDREMWKVVERCMRKDKLDDLRNGKVVPFVENKDAKVVKGGVASGVACDGHAKRRDKGTLEKQTIKKQKQKKKADEDGDESDGGFFE